MDFEVGIGNRIRFWFDRWCGDRALKDAFLDLFVCATDQQATIDSLLIRSVSGSNSDWNVNFICNFNDWEMEGVNSFFETLHSHSSFKVGGDGLWWRLKGNGIFDISSYYIALRGSLPITFPWKAIWSVCVPQRVAFFVWSATWDKILTIDNLMWRGYQLTGWCCLCCCAGETTSHLLLHCSFTYGLWSFVLRSVGMLSILPSSVSDLLFGWRHWLGKHHSKIWNLIPACLFWTIWRERNSCIFESVEHTDLQLYESFSNMLYDWATALGFTSSISVLSFLDSLHIPSSSFPL